jgi:predicted transposase/invertase (TIGR01784 family)
MTQFDQGYKLLFSHPEMIRDLLIGFVREDWVQELDFNTLEKLNSSFVTDSLKQRHDDLIWRLRFKGRWLYVYLVLEFQSTVDPDMAVRVMAYIGLLYQDLIRTKQITDKGKLPPVLPIVLYNGEPRWHAATDVFQLIDHIPGSLAQYSPRLKYLLIDEGAYDDTELESLKNLVSALFRLEKTPVKEISLELFVRLIEWMKDSPELQRAFTVFIGRIYSKNKADVEKRFLEARNAKEVTNMLSKNVERWIEEWKAEGEAKGEAKGKAEGIRNVAKNMLLKGMPIDQIAEITGLLETEIQALGDSLTH